MPEISQEKDRELRQRMRLSKVFEKDIEEHFIHSSKSGGQNVNKVATCVQLIHKPTGMTVKCQTYREQGANRYAARQRLLEKILQARQERIRREKTEREKERRRKRQRSVAAKKRILEEKRRTSDKKAFRQRIDPRRNEEF